MRASLHILREVAVVEMDWYILGLTDTIAKNLRSLGQKYQSESPYVDLAQIIDTFLDNFGAAGVGSLT